MSGRRTRDDAVPPIALIRLAALVTLAALAFATRAAATPPPTCIGLVDLVSIDVCRTPELAALDHRLAEVVAEAMRRSSPAGRRYLADNQSHRRLLREMCDGRNLTCISNRYLADIAQVQAFIASNGQLAPQVWHNEELVDATVLDPARERMHFDQLVPIIHRKGRIVSCSIAVEITATRYEQGIGGLCRLADGRRVSQIMLCDDTAFGHLAQVAVSNAALGTFDVAQFTADRCTGG